MDEDDGPSEPEWLGEDEPSWFDRLGVEAFALIGVGLAMLSLVTMIALNQLAGSRSGFASERGAAEAVFEPPEERIVTRLIARDAPRWIARSAPFAEVGAPVLAVIVLDDSRDPTAVREALDWPEPLTLAVTHDLGLAREQARTAKRLKREVLAAIPFGYGPDFARYPNVIAPHLSAAEIRRRTLWHLAAVEGRVGAIDLHGGDILRDRAALQPVMETLASDGGLFVDTRSDPWGLAGPMARRAGIPVATRTVQISEADQERSVLAKLAEAERHASRWGSATLVIEGRRAPLALLRDWLDGRDPEAPRVAPVSTVVARQRARPAGS